MWPEKKKILQKNRKNEVFKEIGFSYIIEKNYNYQNGMDIFLKNTQIGFKITHKYTVRTEAASSF